MSKEGKVLQREEGGQQVSLHLSRDQEHVGPVYSEMGQK